MKLTINLDDLETWVVKKAVAKALKYPPVPTYPHLYGTPGPVLDMTTDIRCPAKGCELNVGHAASPSVESSAKSPAGPASVQPALHFKSYNVVSRAVEEGILLGLQHAYKHTDAPSHEVLESCLNGDVMNALCEIINFEEGEA